MNKIIEVIKKDLRNRLSKRWFWLLALMGPLIFSMMIIVPVGLNMKTSSAKTIEVYQEEGGELPIVELPKNDQFNYMPAKGNIDIIMQEFLRGKHELFIYIPKNYQKEEWLIYQKTHLSDEIMGRINNDLKNIVQMNILTKIIPDAELQLLYTSIKLKPVSLVNNQDHSAQFALGLAAAIIIYYFTFSYSIQVMRNVMEEKTNRVVEVLLVAMKPWQLMTAKILGGSILGLIQFSIWVLLTLSILTPIYLHFELDRFSNEQIMETIKHIKDVDQAWEMNSIVNSLHSIPWIQIVPGILIFFILGYLLYSAIFAAIGASVDQDAETQMFIMPVTAPLAVSIVFIQFVAEHPTHWWSRLLGYCPLTSPVITPIKIVTEQISLSDFILTVSILVFSIIFVIWFSGKVFKAGILNYGKTASWKEILKWAKD